MNIREEPTIRVGILTEKKIEFEHHRINSNKDLLHIIDGIIEENIYEEIGKNPDKWIEELDILNTFLTGEPLVGAQGLYPLPIGDLGLKQLGDGIFLYRGEDRRLGGLWKGGKISEIKKEFNLKIDDDWTFVLQP